MEQTSKKYFPLKNIHTGKWYVANRASKTLPKTCGSDYAH